MSLSCLVGDISHYDEIAEQRTPHLWHRHRHLHLKLSVGIGLCLIGIDLCIDVHLTERQQVPVAIVGHPPPCAATLHLIFYMGTLHWHTGIAACRSSDNQRVASMIVLLGLGNLHPECRTLVLLHLEECALATHADTEPTRQPGRGKNERGGRRAEVIGNKLFLGYHLIVGIAQHSFHPVSLHDLMFETVLHSVEDGSHVDGLTRTVDGTIGHHCALFRHAILLAKGIPPV